MASTDLYTQLETLLDAVWEAEADWVFQDRLDLALGLPSADRKGPIDSAPGWIGPPKT